MNYIERESTKKLCCDDLKYSLREALGFMLTNKHPISLKVGRVRLYMVANNAVHTFYYCPFCGTRVSDTVDKFALDDKFYFWDWIDS